MKQKMSSVAEGFAPVGDRRWEMGCRHDVRGADPQAGNRAMARGGSEAGKMLRVLFAGVVAGEFLARSRPGGCVEMWE